MPRKKKTDINVSLDSKTKIPISNDIFELVRDLLLSENQNITYKDITEVKKFIDILDKDKYNGVVENIPTSKYIEFLSAVTDAMIYSNNVGKVLEIQKLINECKDKEYFKDIYDNRKEISNEDIRSLKIFMAEHVSAAYIFKSADLMTDFITMIKSGDYNDVSEVVNSYREFITENFRYLNKVKTNEYDDKFNSGLDKTSLTNLVSETIKQVTTPGYFLNTGFANLDNAMGGGLKRGALTLFGAKTGGFKSGIMLNLALSIKMFSKNVETFDKTKKPCVIYLSLENTQVETCKRMLKYSLNLNNNELVNYRDCVDDLYEKMNESLNPPTASKDLDVKIMYKPSMSVTVNDIYNIIYDCEQDGFEVVALFVDYLSTMKPSRIDVKDQNTSTLAIADNARELYDLAITKNIAVVSGFQLNRGAYDTSKELKGKETVKNVADSFKLVTYADFVFMINKELLVTGMGTSNEQVINYIRFDEAKQRSISGSHKGYFYELFSKSNEFKLIHSKYHKKSDGRLLDFDKFDKTVIAYKEFLNANNKGKGEFVGKNQPKLSKSIEADNSSSFEDIFANNERDQSFLASFQ